MKRPDPEDELTVAELALHKHLEGARERALRIRARHVTTMVFATQQAGLHVAVADDLMAQAELGYDWRYRKNGTVWSPLDEAGDRYLMALAAEAQAADAKAKIDELDKLLARYPAKGRLELTGPTPELLAHMATGAAGDQVARLAAAGHLSDDAVRDLREIEAVHRWVTSRVGAKSMRLEYRTDGELEGVRSRGVERTEWFGLLHAFVYVPWSRECADARVVLELAIEDVSLFELRRRYACSWETVLRRVRDAAKAYAARRRRFLRTERAQEAMA